MKTTDAVIVGGGIVGCVLAKGMSEQAGLDVTLVDASAPNNNDKNETFNPLTDTRVIALARRTVNELNAMDVGLNELAAQNHGKIEHIEVSDKGGLGLTHLQCSDYGIPTFGQVVSLSALTQLVMKKSTNYQHIAPAKVTRIERTQDNTQVFLSNGKCLTTKLLVLADGGRSSLAEQVGLTRHTHPYHQVAIIFNVHTSEPHNNKAYERFTEEGPLAFLPFDSEIDGVVAANNGFSVVWTVSAERAEVLQSLDKVNFIKQLQQAFGYRQGKILTMSDVASYPLSLSYTDTLFSHRTVVVGNAAQALHPIAGQGFNLGLRDIITLIDCVKHKDDPGDFSVLNHYAQKRSIDRQSTITLTDTLVRTFSNRYCPLTITRNMALTGLNLLPSVQRAFVRQTTGYAASTALRS